MGSIGPTQATIMLERMSKLVQATSVLVGTHFKIVFPLRALVAQVGGAAASGERIRISFGFERLPPLARHQMSLSQISVLISFLHCRFLFHEVG